MFQLNEFILEIIDQTCFFFLLKIFYTLIFEW